MSLQCVGVSLQCVGVSLQCVGVTLQWSVLTECRSDLAVLLGTRVGRWPRPAVPDGPDSSSVVIRTWWKEGDEATRVAERQFKL